MAVEGGAGFFHRHVVPVAALFLGLLPVWLNGSMLWVGILTGLVVAHLAGGNIFNPKSGPGKLRLATTVCDLLVANGFAGMVAWVLVFLGIPSRSATYDEALWGYGTVAIIFAAPAAAAALLVRVWVIRKA